MRWSDAELEALLDDVLVDAYGDHEQLGAFLCAFEEAMPEQASASLVGHPLNVVEITFPSSAHRGLVARVKSGPKSYEVSLRDLDFDDPAVARLVAALRLWEDCIAE